MNKVSATILALMMSVAALAQKPRDVNVVNNPAVTVANNPFVVTSAVNSPTPFNIVLPATTADGKPVKTVVIEFITADCDAAAGVKSIGAVKLTVLFAANFAIYTLPFEAPMPFLNATEFVSAQRTLIFAEPGSQLSYGLTADQPSCTVVFSGHLE
jgi:hypothetical protein